MNAGTARGPDDEIRQARAAAAALTAQAAALMAQLTARRIAATASGDQALALARHAGLRAQAFARGAGPEILDEIGPPPAAGGDSRA